MSLKTSDRFALTKAEVLSLLGQRMESARILPQVRFSCAEFERSPQAVIRQVRSVFPQQEVIVRSSSRSEDGHDTSNAGKFTSVANVDSSCPDDLRKAISRVLRSYGRRQDDDQIFVQPHLVHMTRCGVVLTADLDTLAPYYLVNYDESGAHDTVTAGTSDGLKTYVHFKNAPVLPRTRWLADLFTACKECEQILSCDHLDVEFAFNDEGVLFIFQARPIIRGEKKDLSDLPLEDALDKVARKIEKVFRPHPELIGQRGMLGVMPDWNPAEIIGLKPRPLALSLYKELITDSIWAYQRDNYGYRNLRSHPLLVALLGRPYIDIRASFNSFIPKSLRNSTAERLMNVYMKKLENVPHNHDKVEFEIVYSCYDFDLSERLEALGDWGISRDRRQEIEASLLSLTQRVIAPDGLCRQDLVKIEQLNGRHQEIVDSDLPSIDKIYWLVEHCKRYGTLPFAGVARAAFIGIQLLQSLIRLDVISRGDADAFLRSINTVSKQLSFELFNLALDCPQSKTEFLKKYGHLRPGTYDILSPRYDENFDEYFAQTDRRTVPSDDAFQFSAWQLRRIDALLERSSLQVTSDQLLAFIRQAVEGREYAKFVFTKTLSEVLHQTKMLGERLGLSREELSFVDIQRILELYACVDQRDLRDILTDDISRSRMLYQFTNAVKLPPLITTPEDIYSFEAFTERPNFVTLRRIKAPVVLEAELGSTDPKGKIVFIRSADPGYDFLFAKSIGGLVTAFGGANSHMAIRCAELGIPAVIGAGESNFAVWSSAAVLEIDAANQLVHVLYEKSTRHAAAA